MRSGAGFAEVASAYGGTYDPGDPDPPDPPDPPNPNEPGPTDWDPTALRVGNEWHAYGRNINGTSIDGNTTLLARFRNRSGLGEAGLNVMKFGGAAPLSGNLSAANIGLALHDETKVIAGVHWWFNDPNNPLSYIRGRYNTDGSDAYKAAYRARVDRGYDRVRGFGDGTYDAKLTAWGNAVANMTRARRRRVFWRLCHEMTGPWYAWSPFPPVGYPAEWWDQTLWEEAFVDAWVRTVDVVRNRLPVAERNDFRVVMNVAGNAAASASVRAGFNRIIAALDNSYVHCLSLDYYADNLGNELTLWPNLWTMVRNACIALDVPTAVDETGPRWDAVKDDWVNDTNDEDRIAVLDRMITDVMAEIDNFGVAWWLWYETTPGLGDGTGEQVATQMFGPSGFVAPGKENTTVTIGGETWQTNWADCVLHYRAYHQALAAAGRIAA